MFGIWDSRTNSFYSVAASVSESIVRLNEAVRDLCRRGFAAEDISGDLDHQVIESVSGRGIALFGYNLYGTGDAAYSLLAVHIISP